MSEAKDIGESTDRKLESALSKVWYAKLEAQRQHEMDYNGRQEHHHDFRGQRRS